MSRVTIEEYVAARIEAALVRTPPDFDVYAFSLWVFYVDDDPRRPCVWFGSNSERQVEASLERASDSDEARWNFAFWAQNDLEVFGGKDLQGAAVFRDWFEHDLECWFGEGGESEAADGIGLQMESAFFGKMADVVAVLHDRGKALGPLGRVVPIIVHGLEYFDEVAVQNERANPTGFCRLSSLGSVGACRLSLRTEVVSVASVSLVINLSSVWFETGRI